MRMIVIPRLGGPEVLTMVEVKQPTAGPDEVLVKLHYAGLTCGDIYQREGTYRSGPPLKDSEAPLRIGGEGAGVEGSRRSDSLGLFLHGYTPYSIL